MTPEERAQQIASLVTHNTADWSLAVERIAAAIRAAVEAERERCAALARAKAGPFGGVGLLTDFLDLADAIAGKVRKPGDKATCKACGESIEYNGQHWRHIGPAQPRHPAQPAE